ncbi:MAG: glycosyltransferase family 39 protein [Desulfarculus sp.]|nr:glycosyltransferase family 39 protein [Desulfarculus sp.]
MKAGAVPTRKWLILLAGLLVCLGFALWRAGQAGEAVVDFGRQQALAGQQGMLVWLYDNPFQTGPARATIHPAPRLHQDRDRKGRRPYPFAWRWVGLLRVDQPGQYVLGVFASEAVRLRLDGRRLVERWVGSPPQPHQVLVNLEPGLHLLDLEDVQGTESLDLSLYWLPPDGQGFETIPSHRLTPLDPNTDPAALDELNFLVQRWRALIWLLPLAWLGLWWLGLRDWPRTRRFLRRDWPFLLVLGLAGLLRLLWGPTVPGISGESAFYIWRSELIIEGARPFQGMITRNGPFFEYLMALPTLVWGAIPWVLTASAAALNLLALVFCYRVLVREAGRAQALIACLVLAVFPAGVMFARIPLDYTSLGPLLFFWGLDLLSRGRTRPGLAVAAGLLWGLGIFNHSIFIVFPACLGLAALLIGRMKIIQAPQTWGLGLGMVLAMLPRAINRMLLPDQDPMSFLNPARFLDLPGFLQIFWRTLDGEVVYRLYTGQLLMDGHAILAWAVVVAALVLVVFAWRRDGQAWLDLTPLIALGAHLLIAPIGAPTANPRYFINAAILAALVLARAFFRLWRAAPGRWKVLPGLIMAAWLGLSLTSLGVNYFYCHLTSGGRPLVWDSPLLDHVSDAWMNHAELAEVLKQRGYPVVATGDYWHHTLHLALNLYQGRERVFQATDIASRSNTERAAVFYNSPEGRERVKTFLTGNAEEIYLPVSLGPELDRKYLLFERTWPPVDYPSDLEGFR